MGLRAALGFRDLTLAEMPGALLLDLRPAYSTETTLAVFFLFCLPNLEAKCVPVSTSGLALSLFFVAPTFLNISQVSLPAVLMWPRQLLLCWEMSLQQDFTSYNEFLVFCFVLCF